MASTIRYPLFLRGVSALGTARLRELAEHAQIAVAAKMDAPQIAARLLARLELPAELQRFGVTDADLDVIGRAIGVGGRADWRPAISAEEFARLPFYKKPTYEQDVWQALMAEEAPKAPRAEPKATKRKTAKPKRATAAKRKRR